MLFYINLKNKLLNINIFFKSVNNFLNNKCCLLKLLKKKIAQYIMIHSIHTRTVVIIVLFLGTCGRLNAT